MYLCIYVFDTNIFNYLFMCMCSVHIYVGCAGIYACVHVITCGYMCVCMHVSLCMSICVFACACMCISVYYITCMCM